MTVNLVVRFKIACIDLCGYALRDFRVHKDLTNMRIKKAKRPGCWMLFVFIYLHFAPNCFARFIVFGIFLRHSLSYNLGAF